MLKFDEVNVGDLVCLIYRYHLTMAERVVRITWKGESHFSYTLEEYNIGTRKKPKFVKPQLAVKKTKKGIHLKGSISAQFWEKNQGPDSFII